MPYTLRLSIQNTNNPRLPAPVDNIDITREILDAIDLDSYRCEEQDERDLILEDEDGVVEPRNPKNEGRAWEPEKERRSVILGTFNALFGNERDAKLMLDLVEGPLSHDERLRGFVSNSSEQNQFTEFTKELRALLFQTNSSYSNVLVRMERDEEFKQNFEPMMFRLWQATIAAGQ